MGQVEIPSGHSLLGLHRVTIDTVAQSASTVPLRSSQWHLNALKFIEPANGGSFLSFSDVVVTGHRVEFDVTIRHPFGGLPYYAGFDVKGIVLGAADTVDPTSDSRWWAGGPGGLRLMNADGWTRWWNPVEFPDNGTVFSHTRGRASTTEDTNVRFATLSGYKVFAASLDPLDELTHVLAVPLTHPNGRAVFNSSGVEKRHYDLVFPGDGNGCPNLIFDYAVDASHGFPPDYTPGDYIDVPAGFPPDANQNEPFILDVNTPTNTVYLSSEGCVGGVVELLIRISDWQALIAESPVVDEIAAVEITSPTLFVGTRTPEMVSDWTPEAPWATYFIRLEGMTPDAILNQQVLVTVTSVNGDYQQHVSSYEGDDPLQSYFVVRVSVTETAPIGETGFLLNPLAPWPKPGGNNHNSNITNTVGPVSPEPAWEINGISSDAMPVVDPEGRVFVARDIDPEGITLLGFDQDGNQVAEVENIDFEPEGSPILVGCSLFWNDNAGRVIKLYQDGAYELFFTPMSGVGPYSFGMLNIDDSGHGFVHGPSSIQSFDKFGGLVWVRYGIDGAPSMFIGPPTVAGDGRIIVGKVDLINSPPENFEIWGLNADSGEIEWAHQPPIENAIPFSTAADPDSGQIYYTINSLIVAINEDGDQKWLFEGSNFILSQLAIADDGTIYAGESVPGQTGGLSKVIAVSQNGHPIWDYELENGIAAGPITDTEGNVYIANSDGAVRCLGSDGSLRWTRVVDGYPLYVIFGPKHSILVGVKETPYETKIICLSD